MPYLIIIALIGLYCVYLLVRKMSRNRKRQKLLQMPLQTYEREIIAAHVPLFHHVPHELHRNLEGKINLFIDQVEFIGCNGLEVTDEMVLSIAAQACLLVVNTEAWYKHLHTVLIYPGAFKSIRTVRHEYLVREEETARLGESWQYGPVILSWAHSAQGALNTEDGHNVVLHEFAHQFDGLSGATDGAPILADGQSFADWVRVFTKAYDHHVKQTEAGRKTVLDAYGATNHQEFFAVSVETFFEKPKQLQEDEPEVYAQLSKLFQLNPVAWR